MAETKKRVIRKATGKKAGRKRTRGEIIFIVVSILLAISMVVTLFAAFGNGGSSSAIGMLPFAAPDVAALGTTLLGWL